MLCDDTAFICRFCLRRRHRSEHHFPLLSFPLFRALFGIASGHDGGAAEETNLHIGPISWCQRIARRFQVGQSAGRLCSTLPSASSPAQPSAMSLSLFASLAFSAATQSFFGLPRAHRRSRCSARACSYSRPSHGGLCQRHSSAERGRQRIVVNRFISGILSALLQQYTSPGCGRCHNRESTLLHAYPQHDGLCPCLSRPTVCAVNSRSPSRRSITAVSTCTFYMPAEFDAIGTRPARCRAQACLARPYPGAGSLQTQC